jgi:hypothetical protein
MTSLITGSFLSPVGSWYVFEPAYVTAAEVLPVQPALPLGVNSGYQVQWVPGPAVDSGPVFAGFGLAFGVPSCVDARVFAGVRFTVSGDLGTCTLQFGVVPSEDNAVANGPVGSCLAGAMCVPPFSGPIGTGTTTVRFSEMTGGSPLAVPDPAALNAVQWLLVPPPGTDVAECQVNITISDVAFVGDDGDAMPPPCPPAPSPCDEGVTCAVPGASAPGGCMLRYTCVAGVERPVPCPQ